MNKIFVFISLIFIISNGNTVPVKPSSLSKLHLFEGDIKLKPKTKTNGHQIAYSLGLIDDNYNWDNGIVPYVLKDEYSTEDIEIIVSGMNLITKKTDGCIQYNVRTTEASFLEIGKRDGCWSYVGNVFENQLQEMSLSDGCMYLGTCVHELLHALGFHHEQNRPDRDSYVKINETNIKTNALSQFNKYTSGVNIFNTPYDYLSIMHYGEYAFSSNNQRTIIPVDKDGVVLDGMVLKEAYEKLTFEEVLTDIDVEAVKNLYNCPLDSPITDSPASNIVTTVASTKSDSTILSFNGYQSIFQFIFCQIPAFKYLYNCHLDSPETTASNIVSSQAATKSDSTILSFKISLFIFQITFCMILVNIKL